MPEVLDNVSQYGPPGWQITLFLIYIFLLKLLSVLLVTNSLLSAGGQDGKIPPAHETLRNQSDYRVLFNLPARAPKKEK